MWGLHDRSVDLTSATAIDQPDTRVATNVHHDQGPTRRRRQLRPFARVPPGPRGLKLAFLEAGASRVPHGGYETLVRYLAPYLVEAGHDVTVYCRSRDQGRRTWITDDVRCIATPGRDTKSVSTLSFGMTSTLDASFRGFDSALVLNIANGFWFPALRAAGVPFAVNTDGVEWERGKWNRLGRATFQAGAWMTARNADALICDSRMQWEGSGKTPSDERPSIFPTELLCSTTSVPIGSRH